MRRGLFFLSTILRRGLRVLNTMLRSWLCLCKYNLVKRRLFSKYNLENMVVYASQRSRVEARDFRLVSLESFLMVARQV